MGSPRSVSEALREARAALTGASQTAGLDAQLILAQLAGKSRTWLLAHPEATLPGPVSEAFDQQVKRRAAGYPLPYLIGDWEFYGLRFSVTQDVLIPRPETEALVELAHDWLDARGGRAHVLDVGTGTGCIAVVLARQFPAARITAVDISNDALAVAAANARRHAVDGIRFVQSDLLRAFDPNIVRFDLICANLPYIPQAKLEHLDVSRYEPTLALSGGPDGLDLIRGLLSQVPAFVAPGGSVLLEIEAGQGSAACKLAGMAFPAARVTLHKDLAGLDRLVQIDLS